MELGKERAPLAEPSWRRGTVVMGGTLENLRTTLPDCPFPHGATSCGQAKVPAAAHW